MMETATTSPQNIAETKQEEVVKQHSNENAENGGAKIMEVFTILTDLSIWKLTIGATGWNLTFLVV